MTVLQPNNLPSCATPLTLAVAPGGALPLDHSLACSDADGDELFPLLVSGPSHGTLTFPVDVVIYTPNPGFQGTDTIEYRVRDDRGGLSNLATLYIRVGDPPKPPPQSPTVEPDKTAPVASVAAVGGQRLRTVRRKGLRLKIALSEAASVDAQLSVNARTARRLELKRKPAGRVRIGAAAATALPSGTSTLAVKLTNRARKALRHARKVKLQVAVSATDAAGNRAQQTATLTLRR